MRYLGIKLTKEVKDHYSENYTTVMKEIEDRNKWKGIQFLCIERINIVNMSILPKTINRFTAIPLKILMAFFTKAKKNPKIYVEAQKTLNNQSNPKKQNKRRRYHSFWFQVILKIDQWNRNKSAQINPNIYGQLILDKEANNTQ